MLRGVFYLELELADPRPSPGKKRTLEIVEYTVQDNVATRSGEDRYIYGDSSGNWNSVGPMYAV